MVDEDDEYCTCDLSLSVASWVCHKHYPEEAEKALQARLKRGLAQAVAGDVIELPWLTEDDDA